MSVEKRHLVGRHSQRLAKNRAERVAAAQWERCHTVPHFPLLEGILGKPAPSDREYETASTFAQWLGTTVGQEYMRDLLRDIEVQR